MRRLICPACRAAGSHPAQSARPTGCRRRRSMEITRRDSCSARPRSHRVLRELPHRARPGSGLPNFLISWPTTSSAGLGKAHRTRPGLDARPPPAFGGFSIRIATDAVACSRSLPVPRERGGPVPDPRSPSARLAAGLRPRSRASALAKLRSSRTTRAHRLPDARWVVTRARAIGSRSGGRQRRDTLHTATGPTCTPTS